ncbi:hypothetical protein [Streptomyces halstedii]|uniref:hypothetical protein n=1 Tax=Streptomyces halstedii TaxID=1944 RepID=UPI003460C81E
MPRSHRRETALTATALMATMLLLTACEDEDGATPGTSNSPAASEPAAEGGSVGRDGADSAGADSGSKTTGSWVGAVSCMARGTYMVTRKGEAGQAFFTSDDTDIQGAGTICGDAEGQAATPCGEDELAAASKRGFGATVRLEDGVAVSIVEDHTGSGSGTGDDSDSGETAGLVTGTLGFMAPGKYMLTHTFDGPDRSFFTADDTNINGAGIICGDAEGRATTPCSEDELEVAAKKGDVIVVLDIKDGIVVDIDENHN